MRRHGKRMMAHCPSEQFRFLVWTWNVDMAKDLTKDSPVKQCDIKGIGSTLGMVHVDDDHAKTVDLSVPIILILVGGELAFPIDGWHRISKGLTEGVESLPAVMLTPDQEKQCRMSGPDPAGFCNLLIKAKGDQSSPNNTMSA